MPASTATKTCTLATVPYLNLAPYFDGLPLDAGWSTKPMTPRPFGAEAERGTMDAGPMSLVDYLRLQESFERVSNLGVAVRGRSGSALLFSQKPIRQLGGSVIAVTEESSTTALLLRLILEVRYEVTPKAYQRGAPTPESDAVLLIGNEALKARASSKQWAFEVDLSFEWWLWQHLPFVFAVWAVRKSCPGDSKQALMKSLFRALTVNSGRLAQIAESRASSIGLPAADLTAYLEHFVYRLSEPEEQGLARFTTLIHEHRLI